MTQEMLSVINLIKESYIKVYGIAKWNSLTEQEQHDAIMILAKSFIASAN